LLTPEPNGLLRRAFAAFLLLIGVPVLLGSGLCTLYFTVATAHDALFVNGKEGSQGLVMVLTGGGLTMALSGLLVWAGRKLWRRNGRT
jgi:hypothetical protein